MSTIQIAGVSPFDAIKKTRADGSEYWSARDLMPLMGYSTWQKFEVPLTRAMKSAEVQGMDVLNLFNRSVEKTGGRPREDFDLARYAAYLVAMNGDPNMREVAAAQHYFAVQTRVAETQAAAPQDLSRKQILTMALEAEERAEVEAKRAAEQEAIARRSQQALEIQAPAVAKAQAHSGITEWKGKQDFSREVQQWGDLHGYDIKQRDVIALLTRRGMYISPGRSDSGQVKRDAVKAGWGKNEKGVSKTTDHAYVRPLISPRGQDIAWKWIVKAAEEFGGALNPEKKEVAA